MLKSRDERDQRVVNLTLTPRRARALRKAPQPARGLLPGRWGGLAPPTGPGSMLACRHCSM
ncbi:hypothetical protein KTQ42_19160 [Noviherbaspirillum sp. L7-7A]|uniref:hypothetical protein n=1 Tax=Noviherbaspirillum sp. L7-7A TaxID=2850560 RepID=UPI001C2C5D87|nr:hypothetical protein [Noviherbaspirillum sp. L7-7A]MBV0881415.1 hypothetical protein [Noviherbaspirillum sp. L7-7A]